MRRFRCWINTAQSDGAASDLVLFQEFVTDGTPRFEATLTPGTYRARVVDSDAQVYDEALLVPSDAETLSYAFTPKSPGKR